MGYGERHFEGASKGKKGMWARVLLMCGQFERVSVFRHRGWHTDDVCQAIAAMYEVPDLQVDAVHFAIALSYYGLLRVPSRSESSDVDICMSLSFMSRS